MVKYIFDGFCVGCGVATPKNATTQTTFGTMCANCRADPTDPAPARCLETMERASLEYAAALAISEGWAA